MEIYLSLGKYRIMLFPHRCLTWLKIFCCHETTPSSWSFIPCFARSLISTCDPTLEPGTEPAADPAWPSPPPWGTMLEDVTRSNFTLKQISNGSSKLNAKARVCGLKFFTNSLDYHILTFLFNLNPWGYKTFFMLNSIEHEILTAHIH